MNNKWHNNSIEDIYKILDSNENGLTNEEVKKRIKKYGKNVLPKEKKDGLLKIFFSQFASPIVIVPW